VSALRVALDVTAVPEQLTGAGVYVRELARALVQRDDVALELVTRRRDAARWEALAPAAVRAVAPGNRVARLAFGELALGRALRRDAPELLHGPHYTMPRGGELPVVVTIHDLTLVEHPEWHEASKVRYFRRAIGHAARHAALLVCVSEHTAQRLRARYSPACPVVVVPHGVDHERFRPEEPAPGHDAAALAPLAPGERYVLFLGTLEPRKNLVALVEAFDRLAANDRELRLVLAGRAGWGNRPLEEAIDRSGHRARIHRLGYVSDAAAPALLRNAAAVAYPSKEEGFGLPALEALACGAPLVTSADSVMAELAGTAAWSADATPGALAEALSAALAAPGARRAEGIARAAEFTWEQSAAGHVACYRDALA